MDELQSAYQRPAEPVVAFTQLQAQEGDNELVLMGKMLSVLGLSLRSGVLVDEGGVARAVRNSGPKNIAASTGTGEIVAAVTGMRIRVLSVIGLAGGTATELTFKSGSTAISLLFSNAANGGEILPHNPHGWFQTAAGEALNVTTGAGSTTGIQINYILVPAYLTDEHGLVLTDETGNALLDS